MALKAFDLIDRNDAAQIELATWLDFGEGRSAAMSDDSFGEDIDLALLDVYCRRYAIGPEAIEKYISERLADSTDTLDGRIVTAKCDLLEMARKEAFVV